VKTVRFSTYVLPLPLGEGRGCLQDVGKGREQERKLAGKWIITIALITLVAISIPTAQAATNYDYKGHIKYRSLLTNYPGNSLFQDFSDDPAWDNNADLRLNFSAYKDSWTLQADYQLLTIAGDTVSMLQQNPGIGFAPQPIADDEKRLMDLTHVISEDADSITAHRLDRLNLSYTTDQAVIRVGRQAVSWGNGLIYNPMDFLNPFDPAAVDKEYKTGDDMIYGQYLFNSGNDLQAVSVGRRNDNGDIDSDVASIAAKYHWFLDDYEVDFLLAEHYDDRTIGLGGVANAGGSIWRSDIVATDVDGESFVSAVVNFSYSWISWDKNVSAVVEYYRNGFGIDDGNYSPTNLSTHPELLQRLARGELFTLGQNYLATAATIELSPLWLFTPNLFVNLDDNSVMLQLLSQHDLRQNLQLLIAANFPFGDEGTEFGGIDSGVPGRPLSVGESLFVQLGWYF
jgi:hypothetical protein